MTVQWWKSATLYAWASPRNMNLKWDYKAAVEAFQWESRGGFIDSKNGYFVGKKWLDITISLWQEMLLEGLTCRDEIVRDSPPITRSRVKEIVYKLAIADMGIMYKYRLGLF